MRCRQRASVLIAVLWSCLGLVSVVLLFGHSMLMSYRGADNDLSGRQADQAIDGMARYLEAVMTDVEHPGDFPDATLYQSEEVVIGEASAWLLGRDANAIPGSDSNTTYGLVDEASKLNLNTATAAMLGALPGMTSELAAAIIDWRDTDEDLTAGGAESETYLRLQPGHNCKNAPFESVDELALVNGATREILYGEDSNLNGVLDPNEDDSDDSLPADNADGKLDAGILDYVTVFSRLPNKREDGTARVNVSRPSRELNTLLGEKFSASRAAEIGARLGAVFTFTSELAFYVRSGMKAEEFALISDAITVVSGDYISGRVNVNTASETVLKCIPGIGDKASTLVAARAGRAQQDFSATWIVDTLGEAGVVAAGPYVTGQSFQVSADIAAVGRHGRGYRRTRLVIDTSTGSARIVYRRNLAALGWALGSSVRQILAREKERK